MPTTPPWKRKNPKREHTKLSPSAKKSARARARRAGRRYPNLVDNMNAAKRSAKPRTKDPRGGLTAAGRAEFRERQGSHLRPGVKKPERDMTPDEMKRKGSWARRFYGRKGKLPKLVDEHGRPTRFALTAAAWGEPVPKTQAQARAIAKKGERLLEQYRKRR